MDRAVAPYPHWSAQVTERAVAAAHAAAWAVPHRVGNWALDLAILGARAAGTAPTPPVYQGRAYYSVREWLHGE